MSFPSRVAAALLTASLAACADTPPPPTPPPAAPVATRDPRLVDDEMRSAVVAQSSRLADARSWDAATSSERRAAAEAVAVRETEFQLVRMETFSCGTQTHEVAIFDHPKTGLEFVLVPAGTFVMGSPIHEPERAAEETQHPVTIATPFLIAQTPCTQAVYEIVVGANPSRFRGPTLPVDSVSWTDATAFCARVGLVLPSEAEWEYACRAGTTTTYCFGDDVTELGDYAWFGVKLKSADAGTHPVGQKKANAFGLYDVHGNVWQWCADTCDTLPNGRPIRATGASEDLPRVMRGGNWMSPPRYERSAHRARSWNLDVGTRTNGFRPAKRVSLE